MTNTCILNMWRICYMLVITNDVELYVVIILGKSGVLLMPKKSLGLSRLKHFSCGQSA